jgi:hypothetical protein
MSEPEAFLSKCEIFVEVVFKDLFVPEVHLGV